MFWRKTTRSESSGRVSPKQPNRRSAGPLAFEWRVSFADRWFADVPAETQRSSQTPSESSGREGGANAGSEQVESAA